MYLYLKLLWLLMEADMLAGTWEIAGYPQISEHQPTFGFLSRFPEQLQSLYELIGILLGWPLTCNRLTK
jgi:hypothetical protein